MRPTKNSPMMKINRGDNNELARKRAESRSRLVTGIDSAERFRSNYDGIRWKSKERKHAIA